MKAKDVHGCFEQAAAAWHTMSLRVRCGRDHDHVRRRRRNRLRRGRARSERRTVQLSSMLDVPRKNVAELDARMFREMARVVKASGVAVGNEVERHFAWMREEHASVRLGHLG